MTGAGTESRGAEPGILPAIGNLIALMGPLRPRYVLVVALGLLPALWSLVTFLAASAVVQSLFGGIAPEAEPGGVLKSVHDLVRGLEPARQTMIGLLATSASVFLGTLLSIVLTRVQLSFLDRFIVQVQDHCLSHVLRFRQSFHDGKDSGDLVQLITAEIKLARNVLKNVTTGIANLLGVAVYTLILLVISPNLTLIFLVLGSGAWGFARALNRRVLLVGRQALQARNALIGRTQEAFFGIKSVKLLTAEGRLIREAHGHAVDAETLRSRGALLQAAQGAVMQFFGLFSIAGVMTFSLWNPSILPTAMVVLYLLVGWKLISYAATMVGSWTVITGNLPSIQALHALLDKARIEQETSGEKKGDRLLEDQIRLEGVGLVYPGGTRALADIDLTITRGESLGIVGASGSGKSSLAALLTRLYDPTEGRITVDGTPLPEFDVTWLRERVGMLAQDGFLFNTTVRQNILIGRPEATREELEEASRLAHAHTFIERLPQGYETPIGDRGVRLSGGQRQRINIAQIFLRNPELLILDEATSALDSESEALVQEAVDRLSTNRTVVVVAHRLSTLRNVDRILVLEDGRMVEEGTWDELIDARGAFARAWDLQTGSEA